MSILTLILMLVVIHLMIVIVYNDYFFSLQALTHSLTQYLILPCKAMI